MSDNENMKESLEVQQEDIESKEVETSFLRSLIDQYRQNQSLVLALIFGIPVFSAFFYPFLTNNFTGTGYYLLSFTLVFLYAAMTLSLNLEVGYLGLPNFGKVAFIAIGGYTYAISMMNLREDYSEGDTFYFGLKYTLGLGIVYSVILAVIVTGIFGVILTIPTLRLREDYLAIVTIVAGEMLRLIAFNQEELGGFEGIGVDNPVHSQFDTQQLIGGYYLNLTSLIILLAVIGGGHGLYYYLYRRHDINLIEQDQRRVINRSVQRVITIATLVAIIIITMEYFKVFGEVPRISLHLFLIMFVITLVIYKSIGNFISTRIPFFNSTSPHRGVDLIFGLNYFMVLSNYIRGLSKDHDTFQLRVFRLFTDFNPFNGNINYEPHYLFVNVEIITINWFSTLIALFTLLIVYVVMEEIYYSPFGRTLRAIREDDTSATSVGKSIFHYRLRALIIASSLAGFAGAMFVAVTPTSAASQNYLPLLTFQLYIYLIVGGTGNNRGAVFGATVMVLLERVTKGTFVLEAEIFNQWRYPDGSKLDPINYGIILSGIILVLFLIYAPDGIFPEKKYNNQRYYDMLTYTEEERAQDDRLLAALIKLSRTDLETEEWIE